MYRKETKNVVFANFFDTIAQRSIKHNNKEGKLELKRVQDFLNEYLDENSYMFILTVLDHTSLDDFLVLFDEVAQGIDETKIKNLSFNITGYSDTYRLSKSHKLPNSGIVINQYSSNKKTVTKSLIKNFSIGKKDHIVAAGSSLHDINMLLKLHDMGGASYYIDRHYLPISDNLNINDMITRIASHTGDSKKFTPTFNNLLEQYRAGEISKEELQTKYVTCQISDVCDCFIHRDPVQLQEILEKKLILARDSSNIMKNLKK